MNYILLSQIKENFTKIVMEKQDLHVFILDDQESSLQKFMQIYGSRTRLNKEYWLLDISSVNNPEEKLQNLSIDLDDDLFWYSNIQNITGHFLEKVMSKLPPNHNFQIISFEFCHPFTILHFCSILE